MHLKYIVLCVELLRTYFLTICALAFISSGCIPEKGFKSERPVIVTTTGIIADAVRNIVGDSAKVIALMGPGVDPHLYKASMGDLKKLMESDLVLYQGLHLEGKMGEVLQKLGRTHPVIALANRIPSASILVPESGGDFPDPHIWFDVQLWKLVVKEADRILKKQFPESHAYFDANTIQYLKRLDSLDTWISKQLKEIPESRRILITSHDAFRYFGEAYGIQVKGLQGISTQAEFGLKDISDMVKLITDRNVKAVFVEKSLSSKSLEAVIEGVRSRGKQVRIGATLYTDALGESGTSEGTYIGMVEYNVRSIVRGLK